MDIVNKVADLITDDPSVFNEYMDMDAPPQVNTPAMVKPADNYGVQAQNNQKLFMAYKEFFEMSANGNPQILFYFESPNPELNREYKQFKADLEKLGITWDTISNGKVNNLDALRKGFQLYKNLNDSIQQNIIVDHSGRVSQDDLNRPSFLDAQRAIRQSVIAPINDLEKSIGGNINR